MGYYKDKVAIVTGGASGLGRALCLQLGQQGATVVPVDIDQDGAQEVADLIKQAGGRSHFAFLDVTIYENAQVLIREIVLKFGRLDLIFNNAGTAILGETRDLTVNHWRNVLDVNLMGVIYSAISAYNYMVKQGYGQIVNIGSLAGLIPIPKEIPYCTSKWAIVGFTNSLRVEGMDLGIKVNLVCPGILRTPIHEKITSVNVDLSKKNKSGSTRHFISPEKAAGIILQAVIQNKAIIIFPLYARIIWWLYRINPAAFNLLFRRMIRDFRKTRLET